ncbi:MAG: Wzz/FepE/Etk N-terminal domain-containing protein, partial [Armatimonadota bacterium]|nr:Wzz/FepE/Etk N-terminal domain-containing protein [Armatimonadota bacterium]
MDHPDELRYLIQYWRAFSRRWWLILGIALLASAGSWLYARYAIQPMYRASCVMLLGTDTPNPLSSFLSAASIILPGALQTGGNNQSETMAVLRSRRLAAMVVRQLGLVEAYGVTSERAAIDRLLKYTRFDVGREGQLWITADAPTPRLAAEIPNAYHRALEAYRQRDDASAAQRNLKFVERMLVRTKSDLRAAEEALRAYQQRNKVILPDAATQAIISRRAQVEADAVTNNMELRAARKRLDALRSRLVRRAESEGAPAISNAAEIERLRGKLVQLQSEIEL